MEYGSLNNWMAATSKPTTTPVVGDGATIICWSDRRPATVVWVSPSGKTIHLQEDDATRVDQNGMSECQHYRFAPNPAAPKQVARRTPRGWKIVKGNRVIVGSREKYHDYSF